MMAGTYNGWGELTCI